MASELFCKITLPAFGSGLAYTVPILRLKYISIIHSSTHFLCLLRDKPQHFFHENSRPPQRF